HDAANAHRNGMLRDLINRVEEARVRFSRLLLECHDMRAAVQLLRRLIKANMSIMSKPEQLKIDLTSLRDRAFITLTLRFCISSVTVRNVRSISRQINMIE